MRLHLEEKNIHQHISIKAHLRSVDLDIEQAFLSK